jgi:ketosteroid isomerase-like protein
MNAANRTPATSPNELAQLLVARANKGDVDGMVELYEPNAVLAIGSANVARGADQIREFYADLLASGIRFNVGEQRPPLLSGELALTSTRLPNGTITAEVARRQSDGSWRWIIDQPTIAR